VPHNYALQLTIYSVTARACARPAPRQLAAEINVIRTSRKMKLRLLVGALLIMTVVGPGSGCVRNWVKREPQRTCQVHGIPLVKKVVPLGYGLPPRPSEEYLQARKTSFPNSMLDANGGCVVNPFYRRARVWLCPECNAAESEWLKDHVEFQYEVDREAGRVASGPADE